MVCLTHFSKISIRLECTTTATELGGFHCFAGQFKMPLPVGNKSVFMQTRVTLTGRPLGRGKCYSVFIRNPLTNPDGTNNTVTVLVGDGGMQIWDTLPGQQTPEIFCSDLKDVYVRLLTPEGGPAPSPCNVAVIVHRDAAPTRDIK